MASANVVEFSSSNWDTEVRQSDVPVVVDFWAPWCGPCRQLTPVIDRLADQFDGKAKVGKLNVDDAQDLAAEYRITNIPRVYIFKGGELVKEMVGVQPEQTYVDSINATLE